MRIEIDRELCQANGLCEVEAPEVFRLGSDDKVELLQTTVDKSAATDVKNAMQRCPMRAIRIIE